MNALYKLGEEYNRLLDELLETASEDGEVNLDISKQLEEIHGAFTEKAISVATVYRSLEQEAERYKAEEKRLAEIRRKLERHAEAIKGYLARECINTGVEKIGGVSANISFRTSEKTVIDNEAEIPDEYWRVKKEPDLSAIKAAIKAGKEIEGAHLQAFKNIQIY